MDATEIHDRIRAAVIDLREDFTRLSLEIHAIRRLRSRSGLPARSCDSGIGVEVEEPSLSNPAGSSDVGNVSVAVPTIHPYLQIVDRGVSNHTEAFRDARRGFETHGADPT